MTRNFVLADFDFSVFPFSWAKFELAISVFHPLNFQLAVPNYVNYILIPATFCTMSYTLRCTVKNYFAHSDALLQIILHPELHCCKLFSTLRSTAKKNLAPSYALLQIILHTQMHCYILFFTLRCTAADYFALSDAH